MCVHVHAHTHTEHHALWWGRGEGINRSILTKVKNKTESPLSQLLFTIAQVNPNNTIR